MINFLLNNHIEILFTTFIVFAFYESIGTLFIVKNTTDLDDTNIIRRYVILEARKNRSRIPEAVYGEWNRYTIKD